MLKVVLKALKWYFKRKDLKTAKLSIEDFKSSARTYKVRATLTI